ncbi:RES family NAD+ phosphorylase [Kluyvera intermedia]|uniref:RES family NAD+ phosphorylase n=1 Tax=Kluyvera intermedia TaxID=61648 RepID=A0AA95K2K3_KLUIN|nr:RES family NAD+ phosphorylase [Kluyvera intermedia]WGL58221.1 RES family NAD+ phosphorylase [Kluyvera intermedia]
MSTETPPLVAFNGATAYRIIPSRYPTICLFEDVASSDELEAVWAVEALTNERLMEYAGELMRVPKEDWLVGLNGSSYVMAAFTHINPEGARFTTGDFGGYYCAPLLDTAIKETVYHQERIFGYTNEPAQKVQMRVLFTQFDATLADITHEPFVSSALYHATDYSQSKVFAQKQKSESRDGIHYCSVRHTDHTCYVLYRPCLVKNVMQAEHLEYHWNGRAIINILSIKLYGDGA